MSSSIETTTTAPDNSLNYKRLFKEILHKALKTNCLCHYLNNKRFKRRSHSRHVFDNYGAYLDDDDDDEQQTVQHNDDESDDDPDNNNCDTSCYQNMQNIYTSLSSCFFSAIGDNSELTEFEREKFQNCWSKCILSKYPNANDNYGSSIYHYATSKNNLKLLKCLLEINQDAVKLCDSKGMTILTRACQKNYLAICRHLLTSSKSNPNGSIECIYTPLLTSITNGYHDQAKLLLEHNAYPSYIEHVDNASTNNQFNLILSPIRSAIIYEKLQILSLLLKHGANVNELVINSSLSNAKSSDYLNCLKLLFRHLNEANFRYMIELNDYIENVNIYRMMTIAFLRSTDDSTSNTDDQTLFDAFLLSINSFNTSQFTFTQTLLCEYLIRLVSSFYKSKSLKELCRFRIRKHVAETVQNRKFEILNEIDTIPKSIKAYLMHEN